MSDEMEPRGIPRGLKLGVIAALLAWMVVLIVLSRTQSLRQERRPEPVLPVFPSASDLQVHSVPDRSWKTASYWVEMDYPSLDVYNYYDERMTEEGWTRQNPEAARWLATSSKPMTARLWGIWVSPDRLMRLDLQLQWEDKGKRARSGGGDRIQVTATMARNALPFVYGEGEKAPAKESPPFAR